MLFQAEILLQKYLKLNSLIKELSMDKTNSISDLLDLEACLTSQIHNFVNEYEREGEVPYDYLDQAKRMMIRKLIILLILCKDSIFLTDVEPQYFIV